MAGDGVLEFDPVLRTKFVILAVGGVGVRGLVTNVALAPPVTFVAVE